MRTNWTRLSQLESIDSLGTDVVRKVAAEIKRTVADPGLFDEVIFKIARAVVERRISPTRVGEICDVVAAKRKTLKSPGAYFVAAIKSEFAKAEIPWHADGEGKR